jgi:hypothetical protein
MRLKPSLLDMWLDTYEHEIEFNLGGNAGSFGRTGKEAQPGGSARKKARARHRDLLVEVGRSI